MRPPNGSDGPILLVEDDPATAALERRSLTRAGWRVQIVGLVAEALEALRKEEFAAILLDYRLPDGDPWPVLEAAQRALPPVPVILVTAMGDERVAAEVLHRGGADYLIKAAGFWDQLAGVIERVLRVAQVERTNARLAALVESSDDAIVNQSLSGEILSWNGGAARLFGYSAEEAVGQSISILRPADRIDEDSTILERIRRGEATRQLETVRVRKDGSPVDVSVTTSPILDSAGRVVSAAAIAHDITERRKLEGQLRQAQKMDAVGQLAGGIAHDFNNLLTIIGGHTELLLDRLAPGAEGYDELSEIRKAADRAAALTRQLLAFSRKRDVDPKVIDLNSIVTDMDKMLRRLLGEGLELVTVLGPALGRVKVDPSQAEQILMNLAVNARDAMSGEGTLMIETANIELGEEFLRSHVNVRPGQYVLLAVTDTGCGMDGETMSRIFEPFFTTKEPGQGTGLGLATVFGIVQQSGGQIYVYSEPGHGTAFKIYLPRVDAPIAQPAKKGARSEGASGERVLLVEDEDQVRHFARLVLQRAGYDVLEAARPDLALEIAREQGSGVDLLITDVVMPQMGGPALAAKIAEIRPGLKTLFFSGYTNRTVAQSGYLDPRSPFLEKPFTPQALLSKVREVLDARD